MIQISFQLFVILIFSDVLREIPGDVAENLEKRFTRLEKAMQARPVKRAGVFLFLPRWEAEIVRPVIAGWCYRAAKTRHRYRSSSSTSSASKTVSRTTSRRLAR